MQHLLDWVAEHPWLSVLILSAVCNKHVARVAMIVVLVGILFMLAIIAIRLGAL